MGWFEREEDRLVDAVNNGEITEQDFRAEMRDLNAALRDEAEEAAERARDEVLGRW